MKEKLKKKKVNVDKEIKALSLFNLHANDLFSSFLFGLNIPTCRVWVYFWIFEIIFCEHLSSFLHWLAAEIDFFFNFLSIIKMAEDLVLFVFQEMETKM